jgi:uncharacterized protein YbjT (DUF2867 family)
MPVQSPPRKICLLGGTGFVGRHAAARLVAAGHDVTILTRARDRNRSLLVLPTLRMVEGDPFDPGTLVAAMSGVDTVVNLVGIINERRRGDSGFERVHVEFTRMALAAAHDAGVPRYVQVSALKAGPDRRSRYLRTKSEAEREVRESSLGWTILQPSVIFGPDDQFSQRLARLMRRLPALPLVRPNVRIAPVFVGDVAQAITRVIEAPAAVGQTYQLCGPRVYSLREAVTLIGRTAGAPKPVLRIPDTLARLMARVMEFVPGKPFSLDNYLALSVHSICDSDAPGLRALGISPTGLESGLRLYLTPGSDT